MASNDFDLLIKNGYILTINSKMESLKPGFIVVDNDKIIDIGLMEKYNKFYGNKADFKKIIDAKGDLVLPGFVNTHGHFAMTLFRGIADDLPLMKWLKEYIWPIEAQLTAEDCIIGCQLAAMEMIHGGTTTACDMYFFEDKQMEELEKIGFRGVLGYGMIDFNNQEKVDKEIKETKKLIDFAKRKGKLCSIIVSPHAPNTCSEELLIEAKKIAENNKLPLQIHLAETKDEMREMRKKKKCSPTKFLYDIGFLNSKLIAAHCVWLDKYDYQYLSENQVKIAHNPTSNLKLGSGILNYRELKNNNILIALGTDGASSNNNLSMIEELRLASILHKGINLNSEILPANEALKMSTINGAIALGLHNEIGSLEIGKKADIIILNSKTPNVWPPHDPYSLIAYCANDENIKTVIINGKIVLFERIFTTLNPEEIFANAKETIIQLLDKANLDQYKNKISYLK